MPKIVQVTYEYSHGEYFLIILLMIPLLGSLMSYVGLAVILLGTIKLILEIDNYTKSNGRESNHDR